MAAEPVLPFPPVPTLWLSRPWSAPSRATVAAALGGLLAWLTAGPGEAFGAVLRDSASFGSEQAWGAVLWLAVGLACAALGRRRASLLAFWWMWSGVSLARVALYADSLVLAGVAAAVPFTLLLRPTAPGLRLVGGGLGVFVLMVAAAVATRRLGAYGTVAGLEWALLSSAYFALWALREPVAAARRLAWALAAAWSALCLAVAVADVARFHDAQAWAALGATALGLAAVAALWTRVRFAATAGRPLLRGV